MKKALLTALAVMAALSTFAQGTMNFQMTSSALGVKWDDDNNAGTAAVYVPTAATAGANKFQVALFYATAGTRDEAAFTQVGTAQDITLASGIWAGGTKTLPVPAGTYAFQVRGWGLGNNALYKGNSAIWDQSTGNPLASPPVTAPLLTTGASGYNGLTLNVPEPSTIALGILGLAGLFVLRRRS